MQALARKFSLVIVLGLLFTGCEDTASDPASENGATGGAQEIVVEASCGECQFGLPGDGCDLAVRIDGKAYFVDGTTMDEHGDAHAEQGMCNAIRKARVTGQIEGDRFVVSAFELLPEEGHGEQEN